MVAASGGGGGKPVTGRRTFLHNDTLELSASEATGLNSSGVTDDSENVPVGYTGT